MKNILFFLAFLLSTPLIAQPNWLNDFLSANTAGLNLLLAEHLAASTTLILMFVASTMTLLILMWAFINYAKKQKLALADEKTSGPTTLTQGLSPLEEYMSFLNR